MSVCTRCGSNSQTTQPCENCGPPAPLVNPKTWDTTDELVIDDLRNEVRDLKAKVAAVEDLAEKALKDEQEQHARAAAAVKELEAERDLLYASRVFWPPHVREAIRLRDLAAIRISAAHAEEVVAKLRAERDGALNEASAARRERDVERQRRGDQHDQVPTQPAETTFAPSPDGAQAAIRAQINMAADKGRALERAENVTWLKGLAGNATLDRTGIERKTLLMAARVLGLKR